MEKDRQSLYDKLPAYLDGTLRGEERAKLGRLLEEDADLAQRLKDLQAMDTLLRSMRLETPAKNFTQQVMSRLSEAPLRAGISIRNGIFLLIGVMLVITISSLLISAGIFDSSTVDVDLNKYNVSDKLMNKPLPDVSFDGKLLLNIFIILNLAVAFIVLNRTVLRPFFQRRMDAQ